MGRRRRCLLVESLPYHWEVLPSWVGLLQRLGHEVEVAGCSQSSGHRETLALLRRHCRTHDLADLDDLDANDFDFVVLNSLVHEGYAIDPPPRPRPNLQWLHEFGRPSISVVHEPMHWIEKRIVHAFREIGPEGCRELKLLADGHAQFDGGSWSSERWTLDEDQLFLSGDEGEKIFRRTDGNDTWHGQASAHRTTLQRRRLPVEDLTSHCASGRHVALALTRAGAAHLAPLCGDGAWILPFELRDRLPGRSTGEIAFAGVIDYDRKRMPSLLNGCEALPEGGYIRMIGGSRSAAFDEDRFVRGFKGELADRGLANRFKFTGYLPYDEFIERIRGCRFLLPLVDDYVDAGSYLMKLPAAIACSMSLGVPLIVNDLIAEKFDLHYMISYPDDDLASGLKAEQALSAAGYQAMLQALDEHARELDRRNLRVLAGLIERITGQRCAMEA